MRVTTINMTIDRPGSPVRLAVLVGGLLLAALLPGCATTSGPRHGEGPSSELMAWVDAELAPYLVEELSRHPRFRGEPVLLVATEGADVSPQIDALTASVRERLMDRLIQSSGVTVAWRPSAPPAEHHRRTPRPVCETGYRAQYFIGLDIAALPGGGHRMSVRALDRRGEGWVTGFGKSWQGALLPEERRALVYRQPDEYLRGLRSLPFDGSQIDLLAGYLARNIDCLLTGKGAAGARVWVGAGPGATDADAKLLALVERYLGRESRLTLVDGPEQAEVVISGELRTIHEDLRQAWLTASAAEGSEYELAVNTDGYIALPAPRVEEAIGPVAEAPEPPGASLLSALRTPAAEPSIVELDLHRDAFLFAIGVGADGALRRLSPGGCGAGGGRLAGGETYRLGTGNGSLTSVYALATRDGQTAARLQTRMDALDSDCGGSGSLQGDAMSAERWIDGLERDLAALGDRVQWQGVRLPAGASGVASALPPVIGGPR